jgi:hypothetical protein
MKDLTAGEIIRRLFFVLPYLVAFQSSWVPRMTCPKEDIL